MAEIDADEAARLALEREAVASADRVLGERAWTGRARLVGRVAGRAFGAFLLATGFFKAIGPQQFGQQVAAYKIVENPVLVGVLAYAVILAECGLGAALLVRLRPRIALALTAVLLGVFLFAVGHAWQAGSLADCGCFPWATRTPAEAFVEDLLMLAVVAFAFWSQSGAPARVTGLKIGAVGAALALAMGTVAVAGLAGLGAPGRAGEPGSAAFATMDVQEAGADLRTGEHLVLLMSTECQHCRDAVPAVNLLFNDKRLPPLVAVAHEDRVRRGLFRQDYGAQYPVGQISLADTQSLVKEAFPRLFLVRDGKIVAVWDGTIPTGDAVLERAAAK